MEEPTKIKKKVEDNQSNSILTLIFILTLISSFGLSIYFFSERSFNLAFILLSAGTLIQTILFFISKNRKSQQNQQKKSNRELQKNDKQFKQLTQENEDLKSKAKSNDYLLTKKTEELNKITKEFQVQTDQIRFYTNVLNLGEMGLLAFQRYRVKNSDEDRFKLIELRGMAKKMLELDEKVIGKDIREIFAYAVKEGVESLLSTVIDENKVIAFQDKELTERESRQTAYNFKYFPIGQEKVGVFLQDIRSKLESIKEKEAFKEQFETIIAKLPVPVLILSMSGDYLYFSNEKANIITGEDAQNYIKKRRYFSDSDLANEVLSKIRKGRNIHELEANLTTFDKESIRALVNLSQIRFDGNEAILMTFVDVTQLKSSEDQILKKSSQLEHALAELRFQEQEIRQSAEELMQINEELEKRNLQIERQSSLVKKSQEHYKDIFELSHSAIFLMNNDQIIEANSATKRVFGYDEKEPLKGIGFLELSANEQKDDRIANDYWFSYRKTAQNIGKIDFSWFFKKKNGKIFPAEVSISVFEKGLESMLLVSVRDISARKRSELIAENQRKHEKITFELADLFSSNRHTKPEKILQKALGMIADFIQMDYAYLIRTDFETELLIKDAEWISSNLDFEISDVQAFSLRAYSWLFEMLDGFKTVFMPDFQEQSEVELFGEIKPKSALIIPLVYNNQLLAVTIFEAHREKIDIEQDTISQINILSEFLASATQSQITEMQLYDFEERYRLFLNSGSDIFLEFELDEKNQPIRIIDANANAALELGYQKNDLLASSPSRIFYQDDRPLWFDLVKRLPDEQFLQSEIQLVSKYGKTIPYEVSLSYFVGNKFSSIFLLARNLQKIRELERKMASKNKDKSESTQEDLWQSNTKTNEKRVATILPEDDLNRSIQNRKFTSGTERQQIILETEIFDMFAYADSDKKTLTQLKKIHYKISEFLNNLEEESDIEIIEENKESASEEFPIVESEETQIEKIVENSVKENNESQDFLFVKTLVSEENLARLKTLLEIGNLTEAEHLLYKIGSKNTDLRDFVDFSVKKIEEFEEDELVEIVAKILS